MSRKELGTLIGVGVIFAIHFATWITSLNYTSVASSVIFVHADPIFVAVVSHFIFKEKVKQRVALGIILAFIGASVIALGDLNLAEENLVGDALSLVGAVALGAYILAGRRLRQKLDLTAYVTPVYAVSTFVLIVGSVASSTPLFGYDSNELALFFALAFVPMIFGIINTWLG